MLANKIVFKPPKIVLRQLLFLKKLLSCNLRKALFYLIQFPSQSLVHRLAYDVL